MTMTLEDPGRDAETGFDSINRFSEELERYLGEAKSRNKPVGILYVRSSAVQQVSNAITALTGESAPDEVVRDYNRFYITFKIATEQKCKDLCAALQAHLKEKHAGTCKVGYVLVLPTEENPAHVIETLEALVR